MMLVRYGFTMALEHLYIVYDDIKDAVISVETDCEYIRHFHDFFNTPDRSNHQKYLENKSPLPKSSSKMILAICEIKDLIKQTKNLDVILIDDLFPFSIYKSKI